MTNEFIDGVIDRLVADAAESPHRWAELVGVMDNLPRTAVPIVIDGLASADAATWTNEEREPVWHAIRRLLSRHRSFPDAHWRLPHKTIDRLAEVYPAFRPQDPVRAFLWLFENHVDMPEGNPRDWDEFRNRLDGERAVAVADAWQRGGMDTVLRLAKAAANSWMVGVALYDSGVAVEVAGVLTGLSRRGGELNRTVARAFLIRAAERLGGEEIRTMWSSPAIQDLDPEWAVLVLLAAPFDAETWDLIRDGPRDIVQRYWAEVQLLGRGQLDAYLVRTVGESLGLNGQYARALDFLAMYREQADPELVLVTLEKSLSEEHAHAIPWPHLTYDVASLIGLLQQTDVDFERIAGLEWQFAQLIDSGEFQPIALHRLLAVSPRFFVQLLSMVYRAAGQEQPEEVNEEARASAERAFDVLRSWSRVPGTNPHDDNITEEKLLAWVTEARRLAETAGRGKIGDVEIGRVLSASPPGADRQWPHEAVRSVIELVGTDRLTEGFVTGTYNSRGAFFRPAGGEPERALQRKYEEYADALAARWPLTSAALRRLADIYGHQGRWEDTRAEQDHA